MKYADNCCMCTEVFQPSHAYIFSGPCVVTGQPQMVIVPAHELFAYRRGKLIQIAMPSLSASEREFLITGISQEGWDITFSKETKDDQ